jgi:hypothetical protein
VGRRLALAVLRATKQLFAGLTFLSGRQAGENGQSPYETTARSCLAGYFLVFFLQENNLQDTYPVHRGSSLDIFLS